MYVFLLKKKKSIKFQEILPSELRKRQLEGLLNESGIFCVYFMDASYCLSRNPVY